MLPSNQTFYTPKNINYNLRAALAHQKNTKFYPASTKIDSNHYNVFQVKRQIGEVEKVIQNTERVIKKWEKSSSPVNRVLSDSIKIKFGSKSPQLIERMNYSSLQRLSNQIKKKIKIKVNLPEEKISKKQLTNVLKERDQNTNFYMTERKNDKNKEKSKLPIFGQYISPSKRKDNRLKDFRESKNQKLNASLEVISKKEDNESKQNLNQSTKNLKKVLEHNQTYRKMFEKSKDLRQKSRSKETLQNHIEEFQNLKRQSLLQTRNTIKNSSDLNALFFQSNCFEKTNLRTISDFENAQSKQKIENKLKSDGVYRGKFKKGQISEPQKFSYNDIVTKRTRVKKENEVRIVSVNNKCQIQMPQIHIKQDQIHQVLQQNRSWKQLKQMLKSYQFIDKYIKQAQLYNMWQYFNRKNIPQSKWPLFVVDQVYKRMQKYL